MHFLSGYLKLTVATCSVLLIERMACDTGSPPTVSCPCGLNGDVIEVPITKTCIHRPQKQDDEALCETETETSLCFRFRNCLKCDIINRGCDSCPEGRHGDRCRLTTDAFNLNISNRLKKRSATAPDWKTLIVGDMASRSYSQSWATGGDTPSGLVSYVYQATYSQSGQPQITVTARTKSGEEKIFSYNHPLTESWFRDRFGQRAAIPRDVKILDSGHPRQEPVPKQEIKILGGSQFDPAPAPIQATSPSWKTLIHGVASRSYSQSWMTGGDTPSGLVSYIYRATYSQSAPPQITVTAQTKSGEEKIFSYNHPLTGSWFRERFGEQAAIPKDVRILDNDQPIRETVPVQAYPHPTVNLDNVESKTYHQWWYSGGTESPYGFVSYNYTAVYSRSSPPKITIIATSKNGEQRPFVFDRTPPDTWFKEMFGERVAVPNDGQTEIEKPSDSPPVVKAPDPEPPVPSYPKLMCPPLRNGDEPSNIGTSKTFVCNDDNWRQVGPSDIVCLPNGQWSAKPPTCVPKVGTSAGSSICLLLSLPKQIIATWSKLNNGTVVPGSQLSFFCEDKNLYYLEGPSVLTCREDGTWSGRTPTCIARKYDDPDCGREDKVRPTIDGGVAVPDSKPWMMHIEIGRPTELKFCGGSLIHRQWVLTAAHCLLMYSRVASRIRVRIDRFNEDVIIERHSIHPYYQTGKLDYDVALLKLATPMRRVGVVPVCMPAPGQDVQPGDYGMVMGRGLINATEEPPTLHEARLSVTSNLDCASWLGSGSTIQITDNMFCARPAKGLSSVCSGDSGGPMVFQMSESVWTQYGIISWAAEEACNSTDILYSGLVRISAVLSWIRQEMAPTNSMRQRG